MDIKKLIAVLEQIETHAHNAAELARSANAGDEYRIKSALRLIGDLMKRAWEAVYGAQL